MRLFSYWQPIAAAATAILVLPALGMLADSSCSPISNTLCEVWSKFQWETVLAGSLGLAGGIFVLVSTRQQISAQKKAAVELELLDIDLYLGQLEASYKNFAAHLAETNQQISASELISTQAIGTNKDLCDAIMQTSRLPNSLRLAVGNAYRCITEIVKKEEAFYEKSMPLDKSVVESKIARLRASIDKIKSERENISRVLMNR